MGAAGRFHAPDAQHALAQLVRPPTVHANALHAPHANQLNADIIAAVPSLASATNLCAARFKSAPSPSNSGNLRRRTPAPCSPSEQSSRTSPGNT